MLNAKAVQFRFAFSEKARFRRINEWLHCLKSGYTSHVLDNYKAESRMVKSLCDLISTY